MAALKKVFKNWIPKAGELVCADPQFIEGGEDFDWDPSEKFKVIRVEDEDDPAYTRALLTMVSDPSVRVTIYLKGLRKVGV